MVFTLVSSTASASFDVNETKLWSISGIVAVQSDLVDSQFVSAQSDLVKVQEVDYGQLSSCELSSQQSSCSMSWMHVLKKSWHIVGTSMVNHYFILHCLSHSSPGD